MPHPKKVRWFLVLLGAILIFGLGAAGCLILKTISPLWNPDTASLPTAPPQLEIIKGRIKIGDPREKAIQLLSDAWFHTFCQTRDDGSGNDIFLYGPHERDKVQVILVRSRVQNGQSIVEFIGMMEPDQLDTLGSCLPKDIFDK